MKVRITEHSIVEADSVEQVEKDYANYQMDEYTIAFEAVEISAAERKKKMKNTIEITLEEYNEMMMKCIAFELLKARAAENSYVSELEKLVFQLNTHNT